MSRQLHELFLASCGVYGPWVVRIARTEPVVEERAFTAPYAFVGSREGSSFRLPDPRVSRRHAYLQVIPGGLFCIDLGSREGLCWGDERRAAGWLHPGHPVRVGPYTLDLDAANQDGWFAPLNWPPGDPLADRANQAVSFPSFIVEIADGDTFLAQGKMNRVIALVGRSPRCLFSISHPSLSRYHCSLVRTPTGLWVVDLASRRGTYVNGKRVRCARVREGDALQVGKYVLHCRPRPPKSAPAGAAPAGGVEIRSATTGRFTILVHPAETNPAGPAASQPPSAPEPSRAPEAGPSVVAPLAPPTLPVGPVGRGGPEWSVLVALLNQFNLAQQQMFDQFQENMLATARMFAALQQDQMGLVRKELDELRALTGELRSLQAQLSGQAATMNPAPTPQPGANGAPHKPPADPVAGAANGKTGDHPPAAAAAPPPAKSPEEVHDWLTQRIAALQEERKGRWHKLLGMIFGS